MERIGDMRDERRVGEYLTEAGLGTCVNISILIDVRDSYLSIE